MEGANHTLSGLVSHQGDVSNSHIQFSQYLS
jgi:hypothetical protein